MEGPGGGGAGGRGAERSPGPTSGLLPPAVHSGPSTTLRSDPRPLRRRRGRVSRGVPLPPRRPSGMDSGRDFLTLHGECSALSRGAGGRGGGRPLLGRPREKPSPAQGGGPPAPSAALRPAPGPPLCPFVALRKSRPDYRARPWAFPGLSRRPGRWGENGCASLKTSLKTTPGPAALGATPLPYPGHGRLGSRVWCARRGRGGKEPASTNNQVLSARSGPPGEAPQSTGVPGPRPGA